MSEAAVPGQAFISGAVEESAELIDEQRQAES